MTPPGWKRARDYFEIGDRVTLSKRGLKANLSRNARWKGNGGIVTGYCDSEWSVRVRRDGLKTDNSYFAAFWRLAK